MKSSIAALIILGSLVAMPGMARPSQPFAVGCSYFNTETNDLQESDKCVATYSEDAEGRFTETYQIDGQVVAKITHLDRQGQWAAITFNGKPGMRYEINRENYEFSPMDLSETLTTGIQ